MTDKQKTFDQLMEELSPEEIEALTPPSGRYIPAKLRKAVYERDGYTCFRRTLPSCPRRMLLPRAFPFSAASASASAALKWTRRGTFPLANERI